MSEILIGLRGGAGFFRFLIPALLLLFVSAARAYDADPITNSVRDIVYLQGAPARLNDRPAAFVAGGLLGAGALVYAFDGQLRHIAHKNNTAYMDNISAQAEKIGNGGYELAFVGACAGAGWIFKDQKLKDTALEAVEAFLAANAVGTVVKYSIGRSRPYAENGKRAFQPFSFKISRSSFPSGHTTGAFALASVFASRYGSPWVGAAAYGAASAAGLQRVYSDKHWASDVFFGAVLGAATGRAVVRLSSGRAAGGARLLPVYGPGFAGAAAFVGF
jgi:hypothetical protein